ncbi:hypothetical protein [Variovorax paradoxus]|uniref:hypothetical protein n=1 Tax=Variovorax paradoxus TaxID=34073 RepID=UPI003D656932
MADRLSSRRLESKLPCREQISGLQTFSSVVCHQKLTRRVNFWWQTTVLQFIVDHSLHEVVSPPGNEREQVATREQSGEFQPETQEDLATTLEIGLPPEIDASLVASGVKGKLGALLLNTLKHRIAVLSKAHQNLDLDTPCIHGRVRESLKAVRNTHSIRNVNPRKQEALTKDLLEQVLATCDDSPRGLRDRALLRFAFFSGGRRRSEVSEASMEHLRKVDDGYVCSPTKGAANQDRCDDILIGGMTAFALDAWLTTANITKGRIFRRVLQHGKVVGEGLTPEAVRRIVQERCRKAGLRGDSRRTHCAQVLQPRQGDSKSLQSVP